MVFIKIFSIFFIIISGFIVRKKKLISSLTIQEMSILITKVFYPSFILSSFLKNFSFLDLIRNYLLPIGTIVIMFSGYFIGIFFSKFLKFENEKEKSTFLFQCTINNYSFLPLPIILFLYGEKYVPMLILSTFGSEISVWTIGILSLTGNKFNRSIFKNLLSFPLISIIISVIFIFLREKIYIGNEILVEIGKAFFNVISLMGNATIPVALFVAGGKMGDITIKNLLTLKSLLLSFLRLILIPIISIIIFKILNFPEEVEKVLKIVSIMPCAIASIVLSEAFNRDSKFAAETVLLTHILSLFTIPIFLKVFK